MICNLIWASQFAMVKLVQEEIGPLFAVFLPMTIATLLLAPLVKRRFPRRHFVGFILLGIAGQVVAQLFITWGVRISLASNAALLALALPVTTAVMAWFILRERMTRLRIVSFVLAIGGVFACSGIDWNELSMTSGRYLPGNLLIFASVCGSAFYNTYSKKMLAIYSELEVLLYSYYAVFAVMLPITVALEPASFLAMPGFSATTWAGLAVLALLQYFLSMVIFLNVLKRLDATQAALSNYLIPFFGLVLAALLLGETLDWYMIAGGLLVLASTILATVFDSGGGAKSDGHAKPDY
jgi:drug/metabolite transporter (DMT)-like permease